VNEFGPDEADDEIDIDDDPGKSVVPSKSDD
jgi:hypothetical protein